MRFNKNNIYVIAEVAQAHEGSLGIAHSYIEAVAKAGVDAVKFQTHIAEAESSPLESFRLESKYPQDKSRFDYWKRMEFTGNQWLGLKQHCDELGIDFISSVFSDEAFDLMEEMKVEIWKIPSGEVQNLGLLDKISKTKKPIFISSGMSTLDELDAAINVIKKHHNQYVVMQCTSEYPCPPELIGLNILKKYKERYGCVTGLSDHSGKIYPSLAAITLGAKVVEVHVTFSKELYGYDATSSISIEDLKMLVEGAHFTNKLLSSLIDKDVKSPSLDRVRQLFQKSIFVKKRILQGEIITDRSLVLKKPGTGIPSARMNEVIGRRAANNLIPGQILRLEDIL
jgi:N-acetylneuraminate synthase